MNYNFSSKAGLSLLELLIVFVIVTILIMAAIPYYHNAAESARSTEAVILWGNIKRLAGSTRMTGPMARRLENDSNNKHKLKYFTLTMVCREREDDTEPCWEAELRLKNSSQHIQYYFATEHNLQTLLCVPLNAAGNSFCQTQAVQDAVPDQQINGQDAYTIHH